MKALAGWRWRIARTGTLCLLVAGALAAPSSARADCGDYVMVTPAQGGGHSSAPHHGSATPQQPTPGRPTQASPGEPSAPASPLPCSGPSCSGLPPASPPVSASPRSLNIESWADLGEALLPDETDPVLPFPSEREAAPDRHPEDVYHPPR